MLNNINISGLSEFAHEVKQDSTEAKTHYGISLNWLSGTKMQVNTKNMDLGHHKLIRDFTFYIDEPTQLLGINSAPNPAEYLLGGLAGCMAVTFLTGATAMDIEISKLRLDIDGELDLQAFLGINHDVAAGFPELTFTFHIKGNGSQEQYQQLIDRVNKHSPNFNTIKHQVKLSGSFEKI